MEQLPHFRMLMIFLLSNVFCLFIFSGLRFVS